MFVKNTNKVLKIALNTEQTLLATESLAALLSVVSTCFNRSDSDEGSDYDVLIIVDRRTNDIREAILDADVEMMNRYEKLFAALIYDESEWQNARSFPHAWNIEREGVVL